LEDYDTVIKTLPPPPHYETTTTTGEPHAFDLSLSRYKHPLMHMLPSYRQHRFFRTIPDYALNPDFHSGEYLLALSSLFAYLRFLRNVLLVQIQVPFFMLIYITFLLIVFMYVCTLDFVIVYIIIYVYSF
jgi:hypothetical protein